MNRSDSIKSMKIAITCASIDVSQVMIGHKTYKELSKEIQNASINLYGVPSEYYQLEDYCDYISKMIFQIDQKNWSKLMGPKWVVTSNIKEQNEDILVDSKDIGDIYINKKYQIIIKLD